MHVMHVMASLSPAGAGVYEAVLGATRAFVQGGAGRVTIVGATDRAESWPQVRRAWEEAGAEVITVPWWAIVSCGSFGAVRVQTKARSVDAVHGHGLWCGASVAAAALSRQLDCPLVISPHGMLERWARRHHGRRKWLAWTMAERAAVGRADLLQAMSEPETASCRAAGLLQPIVVYPVGIEIPAEVSKRGTEGEMRHANGLQTCLFLSRLHPVKGLSMLLEAWSIVRPVDWRLVIAGPDQHGYRAAMERLATHVGIADRVASVSFGKLRCCHRRGTRCRDPGDYDHRHPLEHASGPCRRLVGAPGCDIPGCGIAGGDKLAIPCFARNGAMRQSVGPGTMRLAGDRCHQQGRLSLAPRGGYGTISYPFCRAICMMALPPSELFYRQRYRNGHSWQNCLGRLASHFAPRRRRSLPGDVSCCDCLVRKWRPPPLSTRPPASGHLGTSRCMTMPAWATQSTASAWRRW